MKKLDINVVTVVNLRIALLDKFGINMKVRNYFYDKEPDPYFLFEHEPDKDAMEFIREYFREVGGLVIFMDNNRVFIVCEEPEAMQ